MIDLAVILAAGNGSRLRHHLSVSHKALTPINGEPILIRNCRQLDTIGVAEIIVVTGYRSDELRSTLSEYGNLNAKLTFVENERWNRPNGLSVLAASEHLKRNYLLLMADHLLAPEILASMAAVDLREKEVVLAIDRKLESIYDMDDATKVVIEGDRIREIGKELIDFNAIDTGVFSCSNALVQSLRTVEALQGECNCSLTSGVKALASLGRFRGFDIGDAWWQDVDTPGAITHGRSLLENNQDQGHHISFNQYEVKAIAK